MYMYTHTHTRTHLYTHTHIYIYIYIHIYIYILDSSIRARRVLTHAWISHGTRMHESGHTRGEVIAHVHESWFTRKISRNFTYLNQSHHTCEWVTPHMWMSHETPYSPREIRQHFAHLLQMPMSHGTCGWVMAHMCMSYNALEVIRRVCARLLQTPMSHVIFVNESCHVGERVTSHMCMNYKAPEVNQRDSARLLQTPAFQLLIDMYL